MAPAFSLTKRTRFSAVANTVAAQLKNLEWKTAFRLSTALFRRRSARSADLSPDRKRPCNICNFMRDRKSTRLNSSHSQISYAVFCLKKKYKPHQLMAAVKE